MFPAAAAAAIEVERFEIDVISPECVRLVAWSNGKRLMTLTADPRDRDQFRRMMEVPEVFLGIQAGGDRQEIWTDIRSRRHGEQAHGG